ncbi:hypothetical protein LNK15_08045 [Jeotgalicoccus huakuii]|uniref:hypothetical protein n=1 Tax=Jeotgalicoccus TaxID=227979 RepID=UPI00041BB7DD|nr:MULTISPECIES: hypothetical protein [Jeotgalicoccus]MCK1977003.1 hypothetical protein [Jeotgalicoccus huakuii]
MDWKKFSKGETTQKNEKVSFKEVREYEKNKRVENKKEPLNKHGFDNPTDVTKHSYQSQNMMASFDKFYNAFGMLTFNMEKQATFNYYNNQLKQSFMLAAQNDELIKQNDKIIEQNDEIINLLSQIADK